MCITQIAKNKKTKKLWGKIMFNFFSKQEDMGQSVHATLVDHNKNLFNAARDINHNEDYYHPPSSSFDQGYNQALEQGHTEGNFEHFSDGYSQNINPGYDYENYTEQQLVVFEPQPIQNPAASSWVEEPIQNIIKKPTLKERLSRNSAQRSKDPNFISLNTSLRIFFIFCSKSFFNLIVMGSLLGTFLSALHYFRLIPTVESLIGIFGICMAISLVVAIPGAFHRALQYLED
jgi:hypothetical protein